MAGAGFEPATSAISTLNRRSLPGRRRHVALSSASLGVSEPGLCLDFALGDSFLQRLVVAFVLVGVGLGEVRDRLVEGVGVAEVGGDRDPVAGAGVARGRASSRTLFPYAAAPAGRAASIAKEPFQSLSWRT